MVTEERRITWQGDSQTQAVIALGGFDQMKTIALLIKKVEGEKKKRRSKERRRRGRRRRKKKKHLHPPFPTFESIVTVGK